MSYIGYIDDFTRFYVSGWVANRDGWGQSLKVDVFVNGEGLGNCVADSFRANLDKLHPDATGRYAFRFYFAAPLSMFSQNTVMVRVTGTDFILNRNRPILPAITCEEPLAVQRPLGPILVSTMGRSGSTAVMSMLKQHPNIVVAGTKPYEIELGAYYAYALRTLLAAGDHQRSLRTDDITSTAHRFHLGFNPYYDASFATVFDNPLTLERFMTKRLPSRFSRSFRDVILDYYEEVAIDKGIERPIFFAEKSLPERDSRLGIRFMFPNTREVLLVRDLRDVVCSAMSSNGLAFDQLVKSTAAAAHQIMAIDITKTPNIFLLRYEDLILEEANTVRDLFQFLGLAPVKAEEQAMQELFAGHATSASPSASIGRWERDLTPEQRNTCSAFDAFLGRFGYL